MLLIVAVYVRADVSVHFGLYARVACQHEFTIAAGLGTMRFLANEAHRALLYTLQYNNYRKRARNPQNSL